MENRDEKTFFNSLNFITKMKESELKIAHNESKMSQRCSKNRNTQLFDLYWEDIIVSNVLPYVSMNDCFNFRCASKTCLQIVDIYLVRLKSLELMNKNVSLPTFKVFSNTCTMLTVLNLSRCNTITDYELIPLLLQNRGLVSLNLSQCSNLSAKCLQPVILYCNNLIKLNLSRCSWLTTGAMEALALHQCNLEEVDLSNCLLISESCLLIFIKKFRNLKTLKLEGDKQVTDKLLFTLAKFSSQLKLLNLVGCQDITDKGIKILGMHCKNLAGLFVRSCPSVTENSLKPLRGRMHLDRRPPVQVPAAAGSVGLTYFYLDMPADVRRVHLTRQEAANALRFERGANGRVMLYVNPAVIPADMLQRRRRNIGVFRNPH